MTSVRVTDLSYYPLRGPAVARFAVDWTDKNGTARHDEFTSERGARKFAGHVSLSKERVSRRRMVETPVPAGRRACTIPENEALLTAIEGRSTVSHGDVARHVSMAPIRRD